MTSAEWEVFAASVFAPAAREHWRRVADDTDLDRGFLGMEAEADRAEKRLSGEVWAHAICAATEIDLGITAKPWEVLLYSTDRAHRERAAAIICRALRRGRETEAA